MKILLLKEYLVFVVMRALVIGSSETASDKSFTIPSKVSLEIPIIIYRKKKNQLTRPVTWSLVTEHFYQEVALNGHTQSPPVPVRWEGK